MENLNNDAKKNRNFISNLERLEKKEKILYVALALVLLFGLIHFGSKLLHKKPTLIVTGNCSLDFPSKNKEYSIHDAMNINGWLYDKETLKSSDDISIQFFNLDRTLNSTQIFTIPFGLSRPDVANYLKISEENLAFNSTIPAESISLPGQYNVMLVRYLSGSILLCTNSNIVTIK